MDANVDRRPKFPFQYREGRHRQHFPAPAADLKPSHGRTAPEQSLRRLHLSQCPGGIDPDRQAGADFTQLISLLKNRRFDPHTIQRNGRRKAADSSANDDGFHPKMPNLCVAMGEDNGAERSPCGTMSHIMR